MTTYRLTDDEAEVLLRDYRDPDGAEIATGEDAVRFLTRPIQECREIAGCLDESADRVALLALAFERHRARACRRAALLQWQFLRADLSPIGYGGPRTPPDLWETLPGSIWLEPFTAKFEGSHLALALMFRAMARTPRFPHLIAGLRRSWGSP